ncbi:MAG: hypothetical protein ACOX6U_11235 [Oscillospiraceae bacterium]
MKEKVLVKRMPKEQHNRVIFSVTAGFGLNLAYALYHGMIGIMTGSLWFLLLCAYYMILSVIRFSAVRYDRQSAKNSPSFSERFLFRFLGGMLILLAVILAVSSWLSFQYDVAIVYSKIMMIIIATYTFYKITIAIVNAIKARKQQSLWLIALRNIGCADAAASLLTLQRSMLVSFGGMSNQDIELMNALTGAGVCLLTTALGMYMILGKEKQNGKIKIGKGK